ncbi:hypothetical protein EG329_011738 [Mollisiaceae sp. DMI_Dod_QoI]|nr:hypothetical protein EG329_011738 [Helotiales sp. DMI_Dod_QoI]
MDRSRTDLIDAVLTSGWGQFSTHQSQGRHTTAVPWRGEVPQSQAAELRENKLPSARRPPKLDIQVANRQIKAHIGAQLSRDSKPPARVKVEPQSEQGNMQRIPAYRAASSQQPTSVEPKQELSIPVYRPHLGPRAQFERDHGLAPGKSHSINNPTTVQGQPPQIKQEDGPLREIMSMSSLAQIGSQRENQPAITVHRDGGSAWNNVNDWSYTTPRAHASPSSVKTERIESPEVTFILEHQSQSQATASLFSPPASGLAVSRYASNSPSFNSPLAKKENMPIRNANNNNAQHGYGQTLANPSAFMAAATGTTDNKRYSTQAQPPTPSLAVKQKNSIQRTAASSGVKREGSNIPQPISEPLPSDAIYSDEAFMAAVTAKTVGDRFQSTSGWPQFPSTPEKQGGGSAQWGVNPSISDPTALRHPSPSPPAKAQAQSTTAWQAFATSESKKNKKPIEPVKFVPSQWSNDDEPCPPPTKTEAQKPVIDLHYQNFNNSPRPKQSTHANPAETSPQFKPLSDVVNVDKVMIKNLEALLDDKGSRLETVEQELEAYKEERIELDRDIAMLRAESEYTKDLRDRFKSLRTEYDGLKTVHEAGPTPGTTGTPTDAQLEWLTQRNRELQLEINLKEPLFQVGKDVRARYLEETRSNVFGISRRDLDRALIERGNAAVFSGMGEADAAVLNGGFLTNGQLKNLIPVFCELYGDIEPKEHYKVSAKMREALDAYATLRTSAALNSNHPNLPREELKKVQAIVKLMAEKHLQMGAERFEEDVGGHAARHLAVINSAMEVILKFDRKWDRMAIKEKMARDKAAGSSTTKSPEKGAPMKK